MGALRGGSTGSTGLACWERAIKSLMKTQLIAVLLRELRISSTGELINSNVDSVLMALHLPAAMEALEKNTLEKDMTNSERFCFESIMRTGNIQQSEHRRQCNDSQQKRSPAKAGLRSA